METYGWGVVGCSTGCCKLSSGTAADNSNPRHYIRVITYRWLSTGVAYKALGVPIITQLSSLATVHGLAHHSSVRGWADIVSNGCRNSTTDRPSLGQRVGLPTY
jgi:hypothetical protein